MVAKRLTSMVVNEEILILASERTITFLLRWLEGKNSRKFACTRERENRKGGVALLTTLPIYDL